jgi:hypothetical protein
VSPALVVLLRLGARSLRLHKLRSSRRSWSPGVAAVVAMSSVGGRAARRWRRSRARDRHGHAAAAPPAGEPAATPPRRSGVARAWYPACGGGPAAVAELQADAANAAPRDRAGIDAGYVEAAARLPRALCRPRRRPKRVAVPGRRWRALFPLQSPLGESVRLGGDWYRVVGTLQERAAPRARAAAIRARDLNRAVIVPLPALDRGGDRQPEGVDEIVFRLASAEDVVAAAGVAQTLVRRATGTAPEVVVPRDPAPARARSAFNVVTGAVARSACWWAGRDHEHHAGEHRRATRDRRALRAPPRRGCAVLVELAPPSPVAFSAARSASSGPC